jgi:hypothetical protein
MAMTTQTLNFKTHIKPEGTIELHDLPFAVGQEVSITVSATLAETKEARLARIQKNFGTLAQKPVLPLESLQRENLYGTDER